MNVNVTLRLAVGAGLIGALGAGSASADYTSTVQADSPLAWYRFGDATSTNGSTAADSSGNGHNATYGTGISLVPALPALGSAASFAGTGALSLPAGFLPTGSAARTIEGWFNTGESGNLQDIFNEGLNNPNQRTTLTANTSEVSIAFSGARFGAAVTLPADTWHYFAFVFPTAQTTTDQWQLYLDGTPLTSHFLVGGAGTLNTQDALQTLGGDGLGDFYHGLLSEFAIYTTALSAGQISAHFAAGIAVVPEPSSLALLAIGIVFFGRRWYRRGGRTTFATT